MARLLFPHQLFSKDYDEEIILIEHSRYFTDYNFHKQKLVLHRASMKNFQEQNSQITRYIEYDEDFDIIFRENEEITIYRPEDHKLRNWVQRKAQEHEVKLKIEESPMFLTSMEKNRDYFQDNSYYQLSYYKMQRERLNLLINDEGKPVGGKWSYDPENREKMPQEHEPPEIPTYNSKHTKQAKKYVEKNFSENPGNLENFNYPISRKQALENLEDFLENRLEKFGKYQDAIDKDLNYGYHSLLSPALNIGLITPEEVIEKTLEEHESKDYPLNSLEGFLRQIIGWREFIRAIYHLEPEMKENNHWDAQNSVPEEFYTAQTELPPVDYAIQRTLNNAYTHHIERLMVLGNIMLLLEIDPDEVHTWFMEMYIDSYDWVMTPNVYGMSQYSYTEMMTKPYISSSNYIQKMSNTYEGGKWESYWDGLYWNFIQKHEDKVSDINRMSFMTSTLSRMNQETVDEHIENAEEYKKKLEQE